MSEANLAGLRILHVSTVHPAFDVRIFHKQCRSLAQAGADVYLLVQHEQAVERDGVKVVPLPRFATRWGRFWRGPWLVAKAVRQLKPAIVHIHDPELLLIATWLRLCGYTVIYDMHENTPYAVRSRYWIPRPLRPVVSNLIRLAERLLLWKMPVVFAVEFFLKDYAWLKQTVVVRNLPILETLLTINEPRLVTPTIGYLGSVTPERGLFVMVAALQRLGAQGRKLKFECVGGFAQDADRSRAAKMLEQAGIEVDFPGRVEAQEGWRRMSRCNVGLVVLQPEPNYVESYPTKLFEYMALGLPVIASDFPFFRQVVDSHACGICVNPLDEEAIATAISRILDNPGLAKSMGEKGRAAAKAHYSWLLEWQKLAAFYQTLISGEF